MSPPAASLEVTLLIPVTERADDLRILCEEASQVLESVTDSYELVFLVTRPFAEAFEVAKALRRENPRVRVLHFARGADEANVLAAGFARARGRILLTMPAYFDADPQALAMLYKAVKEGDDLAVGRRVQRRNGRLKKVQSILFNSLATRATGTRFRDLASGTRALRREVAEEITLYGDFHRFLPVLAERVGFSVVEVNVSQDHRYSAPPFYGLGTYLWRAIDILSMFFLSRFTRRPLRLFGAVGGLFGALGGSFLAIAAGQRLFLGVPLADRPILVLGALMIGVGVQVLTIGLLGELLLFFHSREVRDYRVEEILDGTVADPLLGAEVDSLEEDPS